MFISSLYVSLLYGLRNMLHDVPGLCGLCLNKEFSNFFITQDFSTITYQLQERTCLGKTLAKCKVSYPWNTA